MRRYKPNKRNDRKRFTHTAARTHKKNIRATPMRGGIRL